MKSQSFKKQTLKQQKYYPQCINEQLTNNKIQKQVRVIQKIFVNKKKKFPKQILQKISAFIFKSPICLFYPLYQKIQNCNINQGIYLLYNQQKHRSFRLQIKKIWKKLDNQQMQFGQIMRFARLFDNCLQLKNNQICEQGQNNAKKWKIMSQNNNYYLSLFKIITKYKKDGIINQYVMKAFAQIMTRNILLINFNNSTQYLLIQSKHEYQSDSYKINHHMKTTNFNIPKLQIKLQFIFDGNKINMVSKHFNIYSLSHNIENRGKQILLDSETLQQIALNDIYLE